jgi:hypothetical protein
MSGGMVYWYDLVTLKKKGGGHEHDHYQRDDMVRMPNNKCGVRRTNSIVLAAGGGLRIVGKSTFCPGNIVV